MKQTLFEHSNRGFSSRRRSDENQTVKVWLLKEGPKVQLNRLDFISIAGKNTETASFLIFISAVYPSKDFK